MAKKGPVFVTERGRRVIVVLDIDEYERAIGSDSILDSLQMDVDVDVDFDAEVSRDLGRVADL